MKNVYLVGFMGTGKTVVGKLLADELGREFIEMDALIEKEQKKSISRIFAEEGEAYFRGLEHKLLKNLSLKSDLIVSCGGGLVCNPANLALLKKSGVLICLSASAEEISQRTKKHTSRPLLNVNNRIEKIKELLEKRKSCYDQADYKVDTDKLQPGEVASKIEEILGKNNA